MFDWMAQFHWSIFCTVIVLGSGGYGICLRFVRPEIEGSVFCCIFSGISTCLLGLSLTAYWLAGLAVTITPLSFGAALVIGLALIVADLGGVWIYRAGAPVSLGMPLVRSALAMTSACAGVLIFYEEMDWIKALGILCSSVSIYLLGQRSRARQQPIPYNE